MSRTSIAWIVLAIAAAVVIAFVVQPTGDGSADTQPSPHAIDQSN